MTSLKHINIKALAYIAVSGGLCFIHPKYCDFGVLEIIPFDINEITCMDCLSYKFTRPVPKRRRHFVRPSGSTLQG